MNCRNETQRSIFFVSATPMFINQELSQKTDTESFKLQAEFVMCEISVDLSRKHTSGPLFNKSLTFFGTKNSPTNETNLSKFTSQC